MGGVLLPDASMIFASCASRSLRTVAAASLGAALNVARAAVTSAARSEASAMAVSMAKSLPREVTGGGASGLNCGSVSPAWINHSRHDAASRGRGGWFNPRALAVRSRYAKFR